MAARKRSYHHGDLRSALIAAATELVAKDGAAGFSLREAARKVGVDVAACYRHFRDRQDLLVAIAQIGFADLAVRFAREAAKHANAHDRLVALGRSYLSFALARPAEFRVMFGDSGLHSRDQRLRLPEVQRSAYEQLEDAATAWVKSKRAKIDAVRLSLALWATAHGVTRLVLDGAVPLSEAAAQSLLADLVDATLDGFVTEARKP